MRNYNSELSEPAEKRKLTPRAAVELKLENFWNPYQAILWFPTPLTAEQKQLSSLEIENTPKESRILYELSVVFPGCTPAPSGLTVFLQELLNRKQSSLMLKMEPGIWETFLSGKEMSSAHGMSLKKASNAGAGWNVLGYSQRTVWCPRPCRLIYKCGRCAQLR